MKDTPTQSKSSDLPFTAGDGSISGSPSEPPLIQLGFRAGDPFEVVAQAEAEAEQQSSEALRNAPARARARALDKSAKSDNADFADALILSDDELAAGKSAFDKHRENALAGARSEAKEKLQKRARNKYITNGLLRRLCALDSELNSSYAKSTSCCQTVTQEDGMLTSLYCRQKWCITCNRIRMAQRIELYQPVLERWGNVWLTTLTMPNCTAAELPERLSEMLRIFNLCKRAIWRRHGRGSVKLLRSLECTSNASNRSFHPHYHLAVKGGEIAKMFVSEWLKRWPEASPRAQDVRKWDGEAGGLKEICKYATKLTAGEHDKGDDQEGKEAPSAWALDVIFRALHGKHLFEPVGFERPGEEGEEAASDDDFEEELEATVPAFKRPNEGAIWEWAGSDEGGDWYDEKAVDPRTGALEALSEYEPTVSDKQHRLGEEDTG